MQKALRAVLDRLKRLRHMSVETLLRIVQVQKFRVFRCPSGAGKRACTDLQCTFFLHRLEEISLEKLRLRGVEISVSRS